VGEPGQDTTDPWWLRGERRPLDSGPNARPFPRKRRRAGRIDLESAVQANLVPTLAVLVAAILVLLAVAIAQGRRTRRLADRLDAITQGSDGASIEAILGQHLERVHGVVRDMNRLEARTAVLERDLRSTLGRVGLIRYNPFEDTGGAMSFALAILDASGTGFVVSSLHARTGTRIYAKPINKGTSEAALSAEEGQAVERAMGAEPRAASTPLAGR
jgi:Protein of unknown function (DUF4446)